MMVGGRQDRREVRLSTLKTADTFHVAVGTSATTVISGASEVAYIRRLVLANTTGSAVTVTITGGGNTWTDSEAIPANSRLIIEGDMLSPNDDLAVTGSATGVNAYGWIVRVKGSDDWTL